MLFKILSLDPGLTNLGWAISTYDSEKNHLTTHKYGRYQASKTAQKDKQNVAIYGQRIISVSLLREEIKRLIDLYKPTHIASEDVFLHIKHINAYAALTMCMFAIKDAAMSKHMVVYTIPPRAVKKLAASTGEADKIQVCNSILHASDVTVIDNKQNPISKMTEHESDAIAVAKAFSIHFVPQLLTPAPDIELEDQDIKRKRRVIKREPEFIVPITANTPKKVKPVPKKKKKK